MQSTDNSVVSASSAPFNTNSPGVGGPIHPGVLPPRTWGAELQTIARIFGVIAPADEAAPAGVADSTETGQLSATTYGRPAAEEGTISPRSSLLPPARRWRLLFKPSDPHIPEAAFPAPAAERCLSLLLQLPRLEQYNAGGSLEGLSLECTDTELPESVRTALSEAFAAALKTENTRPIYVALKGLDQACSAILKPLDWPGSATAKLMEALKMFQHERRMDVKWNSIGAFVGKDPRDCWQQFKKIQANLRQLQEEIEEEEEEETTEEKRADIAAAPGLSPNRRPSPGRTLATTVPLVPVTTPSTAALKGQGPTALPAATVRQVNESLPSTPAGAKETRDAGSNQQFGTAFGFGDESEVEEESISGAEDAEEPEPDSFTGLASTPGQTVSLIRLETPGLGVTRIQRLKFTLLCSTCGRRDQSETDVGPPQSLPAAVSSICPNCRTTSSALFFPEFVHGQNSILGKFVAIGCSISDILPGDYLGTCIVCDGQVKFAGVFTGVKRSAVCRKCHAKSSLGFDAVQIVGVQPAIVGTRVGGPPPRKVQMERLNLTVGSPLPKMGTCSHYRKSFRWFRFPCCGMAYPCDICHDKNQTHPHERAARMICGHCSREQSVQNATCVCGSGVRAERTAHWEGGKGCRDPTAMSRHDDKKYRLLRKQQEQRQRGRTGTGSSSGTGRGGVTSGGRGRGSGRGGGTEGGREGRGRGSRGS